jgi:hypothetical protein
MSTRSPANVPKPLSLARRQLEQWRHRQPGRRRLPQDLWGNAVTLAQAYRLNKTARMTKSISMNTSSSLLL